MSLIKRFDNNFFYVTFQSNMEAARVSKRPQSAQFTGALATKPANCLIWQQTQKNETYAKHERAVGELLWAEVHLGTGKH